MGGKYYTFSASSDGSRFTVTPYDGALGVSQVGAGGREVQEVTASGSLLGDRSVPIGKDLSSVRPDPARECRLPVGDYRPYRVTVLDSAGEVRATGKMPFG